MPDLAIHCNTAFVLTAEVEKDASTGSGFRCAERQFTRGGRLFGEIRYRGVASMSRLGFAKDRIRIVGGLEDRYPGENIIRSIAFKSILEEDMGAVGEIEADASVEATTTMNSFGVIGGEMQRNPSAAYTVVTSFYHVPRTQAQLQVKGLILPVYPAEAFTLAERPSYKAELIAEFGGGELADRMVNEIQGIADLLMGRYK